MWAKSSAPAVSYISRIQGFPSRLTVFLYSIYPIDINIVNYYYYFIVVLVLLVKPMDMKDVEWIGATLSQFIQEPNRSLNYRSIYLEYGRRIIYFSGSFYL